MQIGTQERSLTNQKKAVRLSIGPICHLERVLIRTVPFAQISAYQ